MESTREPLLTEEKVQQGRNKEEKELLKLLGKLYDSAQTNYLRDQVASLEESKEILTSSLVMQKLFPVKNHFENLVSENKANYGFFIDACKYIGGVLCCAGVILACSQPSYSVHAFNASTCCFLSSCCCQICSDPARQKEDLQNVTTLINTLRIHLDLSNTLSSNLSYPSTLFQPLNIQTAAVSDTKHEYR